MFTRNALIFLSALPFAGSAFAGTNPTTDTPVFVPPAVGNYGPVFVPPLGGGATAPAPSPGNAAPSPGEDIGQWAGTWMSNASAFCASLADASYQIDCLAERMEYIAWQLQGNASYAQVRAELLKSARELTGVASKYRDAEKPGRVYATPASGKVGPQRSTRPVRAVRPSQQAAAVDEARAIVARTETVLLRSSAGTPGVSPQITRIAAAVGSNKVLLRST